MAALCALLLCGLGCAESEDATPPERHFPRLVIIGLDGATWDLMDPLIEAGRLPHLAALRARGVHGPLRSDKPALSPQLWTTMATGKRPDKHRVWSFRFVDESGAERPVNSTIRMARTFWEILGDHGYSSCVIGWWNTWPALPMRGVLVSDYLVFARNSLMTERPPEPGHLLERATYPPEVASDVTRQLRAAEVLEPEYVRSVVDFDDAQLEAFLTEVEANPAGLRGDALSVLKNRLIEARFHLELGLELLEREPFDVWTYYSKGIDAMGHMFWEYYEPDAEVYADRSPSPEDLALYGPVIHRFYELEDRQVGRILAEVAGPSTWVLVVSDHGHHAGGHLDAPDGIFLLSGPGVRAGARIDGLRLMDITPLILNLFDVPVGADMDGRVPLRVFTPARRREHPVGRIASHEKPRRSESFELNESVRTELEAELRALGYVE